MSYGGRPTREDADAFYEQHGMRAVMGGSPEGEADVEPSTPSETPAPEVAGQQAATPTPSGDANPFAGALSEQFTDPEVRQQVESFLSEKVEPHYKEQLDKFNPDAQQLYTDFQEDPANTLLSVVADLYGEDAVDPFLAALDAGATPDEAAEHASQETEQPAENQDVPDDVREATDYVNAQREEAEYNAQVDALAKASPDYFPTEESKEMLAPFVLASDGDMDEAVAAYKQYYDQLKQQFGAPEPVSVDEVPDLPPTVGESGSNPAVPQQKKYASLRDALDDHFNEQSTAPPSMGGV